jgi:tetratricopeptide (TPR) repeat protein
VSAAASGIWSLRATSCVRKLTQSPRLLGVLLLIIASFVCTDASALGEQREASLKATHGRAALLRGQYQEAERLLTEALASGALPVPTQIAALGNRGIARWRLSNPHEAIDDFNAALRLSPEESMIYNNRGNVLLELRHYAEAVKDFTQAIALAPGYGQAYNNRGNVRFLLGDSAGAIADYTKAVALMPANAAPFNGRGRAQLALKRPAAAIRDFSRAIVLSNRYGQALANRAEALVALRRYNDAVNDYTAAIDFGIDTPQVYLGRAAAYNALNKPGKAFADLARARERDLPVATATDQTGSLPKNGTASAEAPVLSEASESGSTENDSPCEATRGASWELRQVANARHATPVNPLLLKANNEISLANAEPVEPSDGVGIPCDEDEDQAGEPASQDASDETADRPVETDLEDWSVVRTQDGDYVATNSQHPKVRLVLEMYGGGEPELLNWQILKGTLRGIGLLHYDAGASPQGERLEYIAVLDLWSGKLLAIEPGRWGERQADWTWTAFAVVVIDPLGVPSRVQVRAESAEAAYRPQHLKRTKRVSRSIPPRFSYRPARRMPSRYGFNPWSFR